MIKRIVRIVSILLIATVLVVLMVNYNNSEMDKARDQGRLQACMWHETELYDNSYVEATAKCEYEQEVG